MPINEHRDEQPAPPSIHGLAWPGCNDEPSGAEQSTASADAEPKRAEQSILQRHGLPDGYLDVTGGWIPERGNVPPSLMDLIVDGLVPQPSASALDAVNWSDEESLPNGELAYKMLIATAITIVEQVERRGGKRSAGFTIDDLKTASYHGTLVLISDTQREFDRKPADSPPIVRRPNEARRFA